MGFANAMKSIRVARARVALPAFAFMTGVGGTHIGCREFKILCLESRLFIIPLFPSPFRGVLMFPKCVHCLALIFCFWSGLSLFQMLFLLSLKSQALPSENPNHACALVVHMQLM